MATELLERTVVPLLEEDGISHIEIAANELLAISWNKWDGRVDFTIKHMENMPESTIVIQALGFVKFPNERRESAIAMCVDLTRVFVGKFFVDNEGYVSSALDCVMPDSAGPDEFRPAFEMAMTVFVTLRPVVMRVRWANETLEEALQAVERSESESEEDGGESGDSVMTPEQIARLMGDSEAD